MSAEALSAALEREHAEIDEGIATFATALKKGEREPEPLLRAIRALRRHIFLEEEILFPGLREPGLMAAIFVMLREHAQLWNTLEQLEDDLDDGDDERAATRCRQLSVQLQHHNPKEEKILYPQADQSLTPAAAARLAAFLDDGELPAGWVCIKARPASLTHRS